jgi:CHRD domain
MRCLPSPRLGTGFAMVVLDPTAQTLQISANFSGLTTNDTAAHIDCCAPLGTNVGVATTLPAFPGFPLGVTSGTYGPRIFDLTQP